MSLLESEVFTLLHLAKNEYSLPCPILLLLVSGGTRFVLFFLGGASRGQNAFLSGQKSENLPKMAAFDHFFF